MSAMLPMTPGEDHVRYPRWVAYRPYGGRLVATFTAVLDGGQARKVTREIASYLGEELALQMEHRGPGPGLRGNPTLAAHGRAGAAAWHIVTEAGEPLADLYYKLSTKPAAARVARLIANLTGGAVKLLDNAGTPPELSGHPRTHIAAGVATNPSRRQPVKGEVWRTRSGEKVEIRDVRGSVTHFYNRDQGRRDSMDTWSFAGQYLPPQSRSNPRAGPWRFQGRGARGRRVTITVERQAIPGTPLQASSLGGLGQLHYATTTAEPGVGIVLITGRNGLEGWAVVPQADKETAFAEWARMAGRVSNPKRRKRRNPGDYVPVTEAAKQLRAALKRHFPAVKFSVRSKSYSGGASITVSYENGPRSADVDHIAQRFAGADFDGMTDLKSPRDSLLVGPDGALRSVRYGSDYIFVNRHVSPTLQAAVIAQLAATWNEAQWATMPEYEKERMAWRGIAAISIPDHEPESVTAQRAVEAFFHPERTEGRQPNPKGRRAGPHALDMINAGRFKTLDDAAEAAQSYRSEGYATKIVRATRHGDNAILYRSRNKLPAPNPKGRKPTQAGEFNGVGGKVRILNAGGKVWVDFDRGPHGHPDDSGLMQVDSLAAAQAFARVWCSGAGLGVALEAAGGRHRPNPGGPRRHSPRVNPSYRFSGTLEEITEAAPRRRPGRPRKRESLALVPPPAETAPEIAPHQDDTGTGLIAGERVRVPYTGRSSYFGRTVRKATETAIFEGYQRQGDVLMATVRVPRGRSVETHTFPAAQVRRSPRSSRAVAASRRPAQLAKLQRKAGGDLAKAQAMLEKASNAYAKAEAAAMDAQPPYKGQPSREYVNLRAKMRRERERVDLLSTVMRSLGGLKEPWEIENELTGTDPWANPRKGRRSYWDQLADYELCGGGTIGEARERFMRHVADFPVVGSLRTDLDKAAAQVWDRALARASFGAACEGRTRNPARSLHAQIGRQQRRLERSRKQRRVVARTRAGRASFHQMAHEIHRHDVRRIMQTGSSRARGYRSPQPRGFGERGIPATTAAFYAYDAAARGNPALPEVIQELIRTRLRYERGRFLRGDIVALPKRLKDGVDKWIVETKQPEGYEPSTQEQRIESLVRRFGAIPNPGSSEYARAAKTFEMWHEFPHHKITRVQVPFTKMPRHLVKLGEVVRIDYRSDKWEGKSRTYTHDTKRPRPILVTDPDARTVSLVGGAMKPTADGLVN